MGKMISVTEVTISLTHSTRRETTKQLLIYNTLNRSQVILFLFIDNTNIDKLTKFCKNS